MIAAIVENFEIEKRELVASRGLSQFEMVEKSSWRRAGARGAFSADGPASLELVSSRSS